MNNAFAVELWSTKTTPYRQKPVDIVALLACLQLDLTRTTFR